MPFFRRKKYSPQSEAPQSEAPEVKPYFGAEQKEAAQKWLKEKWQNRTCECCGSNQWTMAEDLVAAPVFTDRFYRLQGHAYPKILVVCTNCGNSKFFNAVTAKAVI